MDGLAMQGGYFDRHGNLKYDGVGYYQLGEREEGSSSFPPEMVQQIERDARALKHRHAERVKTQPLASLDERVSNLKARFPQHSEEAIRKALEESGGHGGKAATALLKAGELSALAPSAPPEAGRTLGDGSGSEPTQETSEEIPEEMTETKQRGKTDPEVTVTVPPGVGPGELVQFTTDGRTLQVRGELL